MAREVTPYGKKLLDPRWQKKRLEIFQRDDWKCLRCGDADSTLAIHHRWYVPGLEPWEHPDESLLTLCEICHQIEYEMRPESERELLEALKRTGFWSFDLEALAKAFLRTDLIDNVGFQSAILAKLIIEEWPDRCFSAIDTSREQSGG